MIDLFLDLNEEQQIAVKSQNHTLVVACPGSGKTRVLTRKVAYELRQIQNTKQRIIALTHTNIAADEISDRIEQLDISTEQLWSGTIHAFCLEWILRPYAGYCNITKYGFKVAEPEMVEDVIKSHQPDGKKKWGIFDCKTRFDISGNLVEEDATKIPILNAAYKQLRDDHYLTFDDILYQSFRLLNENAFITNSLANIFSWICVDEYQDTQDLQYAIIHQIVKIGKSKILYVGDPNQLIYHGLGGLALTKVELEEAINCPIQEVILQGNYRSTQRIIDLYQNFQVQSEPIPIVAKCNHKHERGYVKYHNDINVEDLPQFIAEQVKYYIDFGINPEEICIIAPQWWLLSKMSRRLLEFLQDVELNAPGISPLPRNRFDNFWFKVTRLALTEPDPKLSRSRIRWANELLREIESAYQLPPSVQNAQSLLSVINSIKPDENDGMTYLQLYFREFEQRLEVPFSRIDYFVEAQSQLFNAAKKRQSEPDNTFIPTDIYSFKRMFKPKKGIYVCSCHGVKGEEYDVVIGFGCLEDYLPFWTEKGDRSIAKRLLYVMASRAKKYLHLISETNRMTNGYLKVPNKELSELVFDYD